MQLHAPHLQSPLHKIVIGKLANTGPGSHLFRKDTTGDDFLPEAPAFAISGGWCSIGEMQPIGYVRSLYQDTGEIPKGLGAKHEAEGTLEFRAELEPGLTDIEGFSHVIVIWTFDRSAGFDLMVTPPADDRPHGVFATRSPRRPNPIGLTVVELLKREGPRLHVRGVDMLDGTPILDIKPYLTNVPAEQLRRGWLTEAERRNEGRQ
jgi:tRNA-Thr(GGU) m(6)t(6)A37 methyltransferase TsaA